MVVCYIPDLAHCVVFLGKTLYSHSASFHQSPVVQRVDNAIHWKCGYPVNLGCFTNIYPLDLMDSIINH